MMNTQQDNLVSSGDSASVESLNVGKSLREARERLGLSVNDVANRIKFAPKQIEWLEADDYVRLPEAAFVRGFVRSYARLVELDPVPLLNSLPSSYVKTASVQETKPVNVPMPSVLSARRYNIVLLATGLIIALLVAIFERMNDRAPEKVEVVAKTVIQQIDLPAATDAQATVLQAAESAPVATVAQQPVSVQPARVAVVTATPAVVPVTPAKPEKTTVTKPVLPESVLRTVPVKTLPVVREEKPRPVSSTNAQPVVVKEPVAAASESSVDHALRLEFDQDSWVEIKDGSDKVLTSRMHTAGSLMRLTGKSPMLVVIGNARAVRLFDNGKKINLERYTSAEVAKVKLQ